MNENFTHMDDDLLVKYLLDEASSEEKAEVETWITASADHRKYFEELKTVWDESKKLAASSEVDVDAAWGKFKKRISQSQIPVPTLNRTIPWLRIAAMFVIIAAVFLITRLLFNKTDDAPPLTVIAKEKVTEIKLPDASVATLNKNASLTYPSKFDKNKREVNLQGEAFFNVTADKEKPFIVNVNDVQVRVVGTSFNIRNENGATEVIVESGRVEVIKNNRSVFLGPKEKIIVKAINSVLQKEADKEQLYNYYRTNEFVCDNTPLWKLVEVLNDAYHVNITIGRSEIRSLPLDVTFSNESLDQILKVISLTLDIKIDSTANRIILR
ncbi:MAG: FecR domain-containing protein [Flavisolibacter sp.]